MSSIHRTTPAPRAALAALALLTACNPFNRDARFEVYLDQTIGPESLSVAGNTVFLRMDEGEVLMRLKPDGSYRQVDLDGARADRVVPIPGEDGAAMVFASWLVCRDTSDEIELVSDCDDDELERKYELARVEGDRSVEAHPVAAHLNTLTFSEDGSLAVAWLDWRESTEVDVDGIVDLTEVLFVPLGGGEPQGVSIGFTPSRVLFTEDDSGRNDRAIILSESKVVVVDLDTLQTEVSFPLTQDLDASVIPEDAVVSEDGDTVLLSVEGSADLYKLDLVNYSIDVEDLLGAPSLLVNVDLPGDPPVPSTLVAYESLAQVDLLGHESWELLHEVKLEEPVNSALLGEDRALLYRSGGRSQDVYLLDLASRAVTEFRTATPVEDMIQSDNGRFAIASLVPGRSSGSGGVSEIQQENHGLAVIDLAQSDSASLVLEAEPLGMALIDEDEVTYALLLLDGVDSLLQVDLRQPTRPVELDLAAPPVAIDALEDGRFVISHDSALGLVSFLDPETGRITEASGFATITAWEQEDPVLPRRSSN